MTVLWERRDFRRASGDAWRPGGLELTRRALEWCEVNGLLAPGALVADFGCGAGASLELLAAMGYRALGLDRNVENYTPSGVDAFRAVVRADIAHLPLAARCADGVLCECVLSLLEDPLAALRATFRALRPGGALLVSDLTLRDEGCDQGKLAGQNGARGETEFFYAGGALGSSCLAGARPASVWGGLMEQAGFRLMHYEDCSRALVELAARMIWYGEDPAGNPLAHITGSGTACSCSGFRSRAYGYGLWIARKETV